MRQIIISFDKLKSALWALWIILCNISCNGQASINNDANADTNKFTAHISLYYTDGKVKVEKDTITGYRKYYYPNGQIQQQGTIKNGVWVGLLQFYSENGLLTKEITSNEKEKLTEKRFAYYANNIVMSLRYGYFEGDYTDTVNYKFHKIEKTFYPNGKICSEQHFVNRKIIEYKKYNSKGKMRHVKSLNEEESVNQLRKKPKEEKDFIQLLKRNKIDECVLFFSPAVYNKFGIDSLKSELKNLHELLLKYPNPENRETVGKSLNGVGTFGHDNDGDYERESFYRFSDINGNVVYFFSIYYSDKEPMGIIKYYSSKNISALMQMK